MILRQSPWVITLERRDSKWDSIRRMWQICSESASQQYCTGKRVRRNHKLRLFRPYWPSWGTTRFQFQEPWLSNRSRNVVKEDGRSKELEGVSVLIPEPGQAERVENQSFSANTDLCWQDFSVAVRAQQQPKLCIGLGPHLVLRKIHMKVTLESSQVHDLYRPPFPA